MFPFYPLFQNSILSKGNSESSLEKGNELVVCEELDVYEKSPNPLVLAVIPATNQALSTTSFSKDIVCSNPFSLLGEALATDMVSPVGILEDYLYDDDDLLDDEDALAECSFNSINSSSSVIKKIGYLDVNNAKCTTSSKDSGSSKRKMEGTKEVDSTSTSSKRPRAL